MINPILYTEKVISDFLKYQLTAYPFADQNLHEQMCSILSLKKTRSTPLLKGPYISLSQAFRSGATLKKLSEENILHSHLANIAPFPSVYGHQEKAIRSIVSGKTTLVSTGTGSGKTECFLYPIISNCLKLRDQGIKEGITAIIVYPMNALAEDQLLRLRSMLAGTGITFGMYVGKTPNGKSDVPGKRLPKTSSNKDYQKELEKSHKKESNAIYPPEERVSREEMRESPPQILLTNVKQLELILTRYHDVELFNKARLEFLVFDEAHTFKGASGAETACLIRRLKTFCNQGDEKTVCIATSATLADPTKGPKSAHEFASRFFGISSDDIELVGEEYESDVWAKNRNLLKNPQINMDILNKLLEALEDEKNKGQLVSDIFFQVTNEKINPDNWQEDLYEDLSKNEIVYQIATSLKQPKLISILCNQLKTALQRSVTEEEILFWLTLGTVSTKQQNRHLLRPVVHAFVRGIGGAVVTFPEGNLPKIWLSSEEVETEDKNFSFYRLPVMSCTTCGQHYFTHHVADFKFTSREPEGGEIKAGTVLWQPLESIRDGKRIVLLDRLVNNQPDEDEDEIEDDPDFTIASATPLYLCRFCGTLHNQNINSCLACGKTDNLVPLHVIKQKENNPNYLSSCISCNSTGSNRPGGYREPAKPIRATTASDVHVLAQNMIQHASHKKLLIFSDNRQDAAFQAGWMKDHARRFRLRTLMYDCIKNKNVSVGDLTAYLDDLLEEDDSLSRALAPEVWKIYRKESDGEHHRRERKAFLRIQVLREMTTKPKNRLSLESWGRIKIDYAGLNQYLPFVQTWSKKLGFQPDILLDGLCSILDLERRKMILLDREGKIYSRFWQDGDREIQRGYMPNLKGVPSAIKLRRERVDNKSRVKQWIGERQTNVSQAVSKWGISPDLIDRFFEELWKLLTEELEIIASVILTGSKNRPLPNCSGTYQIDADKLIVSQNMGFYRCDTCRRTQPRKTPKMVCVGWRCNGNLKFENENDEDYDLMLLDQKFSMVKPVEHSAQVPAGERELIERIFRSDSDAINTLVCTPTLEMGVDIGALDTVLMRNVPPLPANYWQRAGRAGRRHRMAVNITYARAASHDKAYYNEPLKLLQGTVLPPKFNLKNELMIKKHVHATILSTLHRLESSDNLISDTQKKEIKECLKTCFPQKIKSYLFDHDGYIRNISFDTNELNVIIEKHKESLINSVNNVFSQELSDPNSDIINSEKINQYITEMKDNLDDVISRLNKRLKWAHKQLNRLSDIRSQKGALDPEEESLYERCNKLIKKLKGITTKKKSEAEGYDDTNTFSVLASEGFLPGYGLEVGSITATAQAARSLGSVNDFELPRPTGMALREYIPGNLIYANGNIFFPRIYHLEPEEPVTFRVNLANESITEKGLKSSNTAFSSLGSQEIDAIKMVDVDMIHQSNITDEESYRFQLGVTILGHEQGRNNGGKLYKWNQKELSLKHAVHLRLVNIGATNLITSKHEMGYPLCLACGQSRSPFASEAELNRFSESHQERCGQNIRDVGFYADIIVDAICIKGCKDKTEAYSIAEALRISASYILEMEIEDLQLLSIAKPDSEEVDILIYDPMPGGSGLLEQIIDNWKQIVTEATNISNQCQSKCETSCIDCFQSFRNAYYHRYLDRHVALKRLQELDFKIEFSHEIPPEQLHTSSEPNETVNDGEQKLLRMLERAGFPSPEQQKQLDLGRPLGSTTPDFFYEDPNENYDGICIYLDGMSRGIHGNNEAQERDTAINEALKNQFYEVIRITKTELGDPGAMKNYFYRLARMLLGKDKAKEVKDNNSWFEDSSINFDFDLIDSKWHPLIKSLIKDGFIVDEGSDLEIGGRIIGKYAFTLKKDNKNIFIFNNSTNDFENILEIVKNNGNIAIKLDFNSNLIENLESVKKSLEV